MSRDRRRSSSFFVSSLARTSNAFRDGFASLPMSSTCAAQILSLYARCDDDGSLSRMGARRKEERQTKGRSETGSGRRGSSFYLKTRERRSLARKIYDSFFLVSLATFLRSKSDPARSSQVAPIIDRIFLVYTKTHICLVRLEITTTTLTFLFWLPLDRCVDGLGRGCCRSLNALITLSTFISGCLFLRLSRTLLAGDFDSTRWSAA